MILFLIPFAMYMVLGIKLNFDKGEKLEYKMALALGIMALFFYYGQRVSVSYNADDLAVETSTYSFQESVPRFGLLKSLEHEISNLANGTNGQNLSFETTVEETITEVKLRSRQYAKRQRTWFRRREDTHWIYWDETPDFSSGFQNATEYLIARGLG